MAQGLTPGQRMCQRNDTMKDHEKKVSSTRSPHEDAYPQLASAARRTARRLGVGVDLNEWLRDTYGTTRADHDPGQFGGLTRAHRARMSFHSERWRTAEKDRVDVREV